MTLEQNFDAVSDVLSHYGLEMSRDAARKKAHRVRAERGWLQPGGETLDAESEADARAPLRLVRTESA
jgi:hypothetical protein